MTESAYLESDGIWCRAGRDRAAGQGGPSGSAGAVRRPALILDRDGVVVEEVHFLHRPQDVRLLPGAAALIAQARAQGLCVVLTTNQSGIARGLFGWAAFEETQDEVEARLAAEGAGFDLVLACPFHPDGRPPYDREHDCRKPRPGMLLRAAERLALDLSASWVVGDRARDLEAGRAAGCAGGLHVLSAHGEAERQAAAALASGLFQVRLGRDVRDAMTLPILASVP